MRRTFDAAPNVPYFLRSSARLYSVAASSRYLSIARLRADFGQRPFGGANLGPSILIVPVSPRFRARVLNAKTS
jgi:hypothetical protein